MYSWQPGFTGQLALKLLMYVELRQDYRLWLLLRCHENMFNILKFLKVLAEGIMNDNRSPRMQSRWSIVIYCEEKPILHWKIADKITWSIVYLLDLVVVLGLP